MKLGSRRFRIIGFIVVVLVVALTTTFMMQNRSGDPADALASADSSEATISTADAPPDAGSSAVADSSAPAGGDSAKKDPAGAEKTDGKSEKEKEDPPVPVELVTAETHDIPSYFHATGSLEAERQVQLVAKSAGQIVRLAVEEGHRVKKGQVLLEIEHREEELLLEQNRIRAETAEREFMRSEGLVQKGLGSDKDFEEKKQRAEVSQLDHNLAKVRLENKIVRAPFSGQITVRHVEFGQTVNVGQELFEIADVSPLEVRIYLPEKVVKQLEPGQPVEIRSDVDPARPFVGKVDRIAPSVDPATSTVKVTLGVANTEGSASVGSFVRARITTDVAEGVVAVPKRALVPEAGVTYLFVAESDTVRKVPVTTGYADDDLVEITDGLRLGQRVVTVGQGGLRHGSKIKDLAQKPDASKEEVAKVSTADEYADARGQ
jgi:RND family efflux transporter MFP subunit